jgi:hypothetical protein
MIKSCSTSQTTRPGDSRSAAPKAGRGTDCAEGVLRCGGQAAGSEIVIRTGRAPSCVWWSPLSRERLRVQSAQERWAAHLREKGAVNTQMRVSTFSCARLCGYIERAGGYADGEQAAGDAESRRPGVVLRNLQGYPQWSKKANNAEFAGISVGLTMPEREKI